MFIFRGLVYLVVLLVVAQCISIEAFTLGVKAVYGEASLTETLQDTFSFSSALMFYLCAYYSKEFRQAGLLLGTMLLMMFVRESDSFLDQHIFDGAWQMIVAIILSVLFYSLRHKLRESYQSLKRFSETSSFGFVVAGMVTILVFSRMMGRSELWESLMGEAYQRSVKNIVEEGIELLGYTIIVIAAFELLVFVISAAKRSRTLSLSSSNSLYVKANLVR